MSDLSKQLYDLQRQRADAIHTAIMIWLEANGVHADTRQSEALFDAIEENRL